MEMFHLILKKISKEDIKIFFQNTIAAIFLCPFIVLFYLTVSFLKIEYLNEDIQGLIRTIFDLITSFFIVGIQLLGLYFIIYENDRMFCKLLKVLFSIILITPSIIIFIFMNDYVFNGFIFIVLTVSLLSISFMITKSIRKFYTLLIEWIFEYDNDNDNLIRFKLSFLKSIIIGITTFVASVLGITLTIKQIFS